MVTQEFKNRERLKIVTIGQIDDDVRLCKYFSTFSSVELITLIYYLLTFYVFVYRVRWRPTFQLE